MPETEFSISKATQSELLKLARKRIASETAGQSWSYAPSADLPELQLELPAFVTLTEGGRLRGCIGYIQPMGPVWQAVEEMAYSAAFGDPRFPKVTADEVPQLHIEISLLSPMSPITPDAITPFKHGVLVRRGRRSGLFLPQVWEQLPDKTQFMSYLCIEKAGLEADAWLSPDTQLLAFTVFPFEEE